jgi:hypothetical protein
MESAPEHRSGAEEECSKCEIQDPRKKWSVRERESKETQLTRSVEINEKCNARLT